MQRVIRLVAGPHAVREVPRRDGPRLYSDRDLAIDAAQQPFAQFSLFCSLIPLDEYAEGELNVCIDEMSNPSTTNAAIRRGICCNLESDTVVAFKPFR